LWWLVARGRGSGWRAVRGAGAGREAPRRGLGPGRPSADLAAARRARGRAALRLPRLRQDQLRPRLGAGLPMALRPRAPPVADPPVRVGAGGAAPGGPQRGPETGPEPGRGRRLAADRPVPGAFVRQQGTRNGPAYPYPRR